MASFYGRKYELYVGRKAGLISATQSKTVIVPNGDESVPKPLRIETQGQAATAYLDFTCIPGDVMKITELRIKGNVMDSKGGKSNKNTSTIEIVNLPKAKQSFIQADDTIILKLGYDNNGELPVVYVGQVEKVTTTKSGRDTITKMLCGSTTVVRKNTKFSKSPRRGENLQDVCDYLSAIAASNGIPKGITIVDENITFKYGVSMEGQFFPVMEKFLDENKMHCYVSLGKLYIEPTRVRSLVDVVNINEDNVKGSIRPQQDAVGVPSADQKRGLKFSTFLDGRITASKKARIKYGEYSGDYNIISVESKFDTESKTLWDSVVDCESVT